jgi:hypothetical protein
MQNPQHERTARIPALVGQQANGPVKANAVKPADHCRDRFRVLLYKSIHGIVPPAGDVLTRSPYRKQRRRSFA